MSGRMLVLDGAMGTMLESLGHDVSGPMWGSDLLFSKPGAIRQVHEGYVQAGADIVETATYQMSLGALLRSHPRAEAEEIMRGAISLVHDTACRRVRANQAAEAVRERNHGGTSSGPSASVALSLGPFGATLSPSQEYAGIYPPPYGPVPDADTISSPSRTNAFPPSPAGAEAQGRAEDALMGWHLDRLRIYAVDEATWRKVEWMAFETVPLFVEIRAIRRAVGLLYAELGKRWHVTAEQGRQWWKKRFWITSAYPEGLHPQLMLPAADAEGQHASPEDVLRTLLDDAGESPRPDGIGINCTHPQYLSSLSADLTRAMTAMLRQREDRETGPVLVLYPDGAAVYDTATKTWTERSTGAADWAQNTAGLAQELEKAEWTDGEGQKRSVWGGVIVGGCCKAGFEEIAQLRRELDSVT